MDLNPKADLCCVCPGSIIVGGGGPIPHTQHSEAQQRTAQVEACVARLLHQLLLFISRLSGETLEPLFSENDQPSLSIARCLGVCTAKLRQG